MKKPYRFICAALCSLAIITQYILFILAGEYGGFWAANLAFFGYFTILTNIAVALAFIAPFLNPKYFLHIFFMIADVRAAITFYIFVVAVVYHLLLADIHNPTGLSAIINIGMHYLFPLLFIIEWVCFSPKQDLSYRRVPYWTIFPLVYGGFILIKGKLTGFYPYPFLNVNELGGGIVALNMVGFVILYVLGGCFLTYLGRKMPPKTA